MNEIRNPEQQMDRPSVEQSPEQLRAAESAKNRLEHDLDSDFNIENPENKDTPEEKTSRSEMMGASPEDKAKQKEEVRDSSIDRPESIEQYLDVNAFNQELKDIYSNKDLSNEQKVEKAKSCVEKLNNSNISDSEKRKSMDVPSDSRAITNQEYSNWMERSDSNPWPPVSINFPDKMGLDFEKPVEPLGRNSLSGKKGLPETAYRYGGEGGYNFTERAADGHIPTLSERSLPKECVNAKDREVHFDSNRYFDAIDAVRNFENDPQKSLDDINGLIDDINNERGSHIKPLIVENLEALYDDYVDMQNGKFCDVRKEINADTTYGVHGYAIDMKDKTGDTICVGGASQYNTALTEADLKRIGIVY